MEGKRDMIKVKLIGTDGQAAIVEYQIDSRVKRAIVPNSEVKNGQISEKTLQQSIPFGGIELTDYLPEKLTIKTSDLQGLLWQRGLWTKDDYLKNPNIILGALQKLYGVDVTRILNLVSEADNDDNL
jgi:hypothetical protein